MCFRFGSDRAYETIYKYKAQHAKKRQDEHLSEISILPLEKRKSLLSRADFKEESELESRYTNNQLIHRSRRRLQEETSLNFASNTQSQANMNVSHTHPGELAINCREFVGMGPEFHGNVSDVKTTDFKTLTVKTPEPTSSFERLHEELFYHVFSFLYNELITLQLVSTNIRSQILKMPVENQNESFDNKKEISNIRLSQNKKITLFDKQKIEVRCKLLSLHFLKITTHSIKMNRNQLFSTASAWSSSLRDMPAFSVIRDQQLLFGRPIQLTYPQIEHVKNTIKIMIQLGTYYNPTSFAFGIGRDSSRSQGIWLMLRTLNKAQSLYVVLEFICRNFWNMSLFQCVLASGAGIYAFIFDSLQFYMECKMNNKWLPSLYTLSGMDKEQKTADEIYALVKKHPELRQSFACKPLRAGLFFNSNPADVSAELQELREKGLVQKVLEDYRAVLR